MVEEELKILRKGECKNYPSLYQIFEDKSNYYLVFEFFKGKILYNYI
jgi:hypothetical protein